MYGKIRVRKFIPSCSDVNNRELDDFIKLISKEDLISITYNPPLNSCLDNEYIVIMYWER
jgi:hypothetical protein